MTAAGESTEAAEVTAAAPPPVRRPPLLAGEVLPDSEEAATSGASKPRKRVRRCWEDGGRFQLGMLGISYPSDEE